VTPFGLICK